MAPGSKGSHDDFALDGDSAQFAAMTGQLSQQIHEAAIELASQHRGWAASLFNKKKAVLAECETLRRETDAEVKQARLKLAHEKMTWEREKEDMAITQKFASRVKIDIGGNRFTTSLSTLTARPDTFLEQYFSGRHANAPDEDGYHFIDRDGTHFRHVLNFLREPTSFSVELPPAQMRELHKEAEFYGVAAGMASASEAFAACVREKQADLRRQGIGWLADVKMGSFIECERPGLTKYCLYVENMKTDTEMRPVSLELIYETKAGSDEAGSTPTELSSAMDAARRSQNYTSSLPQMAGEELRNFGLAHQTIKVGYEGGSVSLPCDDETVRHMLEHVLILR